MASESGKLTNWFGIFSSIFLVIGLLFSLGIWIDYTKIKEVQNWPVVEGLLVTQIVKTNRSGTDNQLVKYEYLVNGTTYEGRQINPNQYSDGNSNFFKVKKDDKVKVFVHYNAKNPHEAFLIVEWNPLDSTHIYYAISAIILSIIFGIIFLVCKIKSRSS